MTFDAHVLKVMIATPGDTTDEVVAVKGALHGWNGSRAENAQTILLPKFWKTDAVPLLTASGGQSVINSQLLDNADIVIVLFDSRLGKATDKAVSGTAEEIERAVKDGKPVHVWFSDEPLDRESFDVAEYERLQRFRKELEDKGLLGVYADLNDLAYKVREAVESDVIEMGLGAASLVRKGEHAIPVIEVVKEREPNGVDSRGKPKYRTRDRLIVTNESTTIRAEQLAFDFSELGGAIIVLDDAPFDLNPRATMHWTLGIDSGSPTRATVKMKWTENGEEQSLDQTINLFG